MPVHVTTATPTESYLSTNRFPCRRGSPLFHVLLLLVLGAATAAAEMPPPPVFSGDTELNFSSAAGNTSVETLAVRADWDYETGRWRHNVFGDAYQSKQDADRTADRYALGYKPHFFLSRVWYGFGLVRHDSDAFAGAESQETAVLGLGREFKPWARGVISVELGIGGRSVEYAAAESRATGDDDFIVFGGGTLDVDLSDTVSLTQDIRVESGNQTTFVDSATGINLAVTRALRARISYSVRYNAEFAGVRGTHTDRILAVGLLHSF